MQTETKRILIVEDESAHADSLQFALQRAGFSVVIASDGDVAWELLQASSFDLMLTDQRLPGLLGTEICWRVRQQPHLADLPIIMLTCLSSELDAEQLRRDLGVLRLVSKPYSPREIVRAVQDVFRTGPELSASA